MQYPRKLHVIAALAEALDHLRQAQSALNRAHENLTEYNREEKVLRTTVSVHYGDAQSLYDSIQAVAVRAFTVLPNPASLTEPQ